MIDRVSGTILSRGPTDVVIDVHGVGLLLEISLATSDTLASRAIGDRATLLAHLHILTNEPGVRLYGFATEEERRLFRLLLPIKGVGPSTALRILSSGRSTADGVAQIA